TGAARGLGAGYARECARRGAGLVLTDIDVAELGAVVAEIVAAGGRAIAVPGDITDPAFLDEVATTTVSAYGGLHGWVNNAGIEVLQPVGAIDIDRTRRLIEVNLLGTILGTAAAARGMSSGGAIVNTASGSMFGMAHLSAYGATKAGVVALTVAASIELAERGIRVNALSPLASTRMSDQADRYHAARYGRPVTDRSGMASADSIASALVYLVSDASAALTGQVIRFDGRTLTTVRRAHVEEELAQHADSWTAEAIAEAAAGPLSGAWERGSFASPSVPLT
ncbi:MAG: SDR family oxidoreductase, partial [Microbacterium sp.]